MTIAWPSAEEYHTAIEDPRRAFRDSLQRAQARQETGPLVVRSGSAALVFRVHTDDGDQALRHLRYPRTERNEYFSLVAEHLQKRRPSSIVPFTYDHEGIFVTDGWYPAQRMPWIEGSTLREFVEAALGRNEPDQLSHLADRFVEVMSDLRSHHIAHGDLSEDNILVDGDDLFLVDYDCLCIPELVGTIPPEFGNPCYQHPTRQRELLSLDMDRFSAWLLWLSLRALAAEPSLWRRHVRPDHDAGLLLSERDLLEPDNSPVWSELLRSRDVEVQAWSRRLIETLPERPASTIPVFDPTRRPTAVYSARFMRTWSGSSSDALGPQVCPDCYHLNPCEALFCYFDGAPLRRGLDRPLEMPVTALVVESAEDFGEGLAFIGTSQPVTPFPVEGSQDYPAIVVAGNSVEGESVIVGEADDNRDKAYTAIVVGDSEQDKAYTAIIVDDSPDTALQKLKAAVLRDTPSEQKIVDAWEHLQRVGGHVDAHAFKARVELARLRASCLERLPAPGAPLSEEADRRFAAHWNDTLLGDCPQASSHRPRYEESQRRLLLLQEIDKAIRLVDRGQSDEKSIVVLVSTLPPGYRHSREDRVAAAQRRVEAMDAFARVLTKRPISDTHLAEAWRAVKEVGAVSPDPQTVKRCQLAVRRHNCLRRLSEIESSNLPLDHRDRLWLETWDSDLLTKCADAANFRSLHSEALRRTQAWRALRMALRTEDAPSVKTLATDPLLAGYPPLGEHRGEIEKLVLRADKIDGIKDLLDSGEPRIFVEGADLIFIREHGRYFVDMQDKIESYLADWLSEPGRISEAQQPFVRAYDGSYFACWRWTHALVTHCYVAVDPKRYLRRVEECAEEPLLIDAEALRRLGGIPVPRRSMRVTVWPAIDIGWAKVTGEPLHVGRKRFRLLPF